MTEPTEETEGIRWDVIAAVVAAVVAGSAVWLVIIVLGIALTSMVTG